MSIRYKFRSSINFDTLRLDGDKLAISIGELRWKIMCLKKLNNCPQKDFDLVLSDAVSGEEYNDDRFKIANGSSVIVKRVPAELVPSATFQYKKLEENKGRDNIHKGLDQHKPEKIVLEKLEPDSNKPIKLENMRSTNRMNPLSAGLPSEPKCHICSIYYKKAVTTQCCYHSLCEKCIHDEVVLKGICPLCSTKCGVEDLQPNVGLNRRVQRIAESHIFVNAPATNIQKYAPDQESGIQGKDLAAPITKRNMDSFNLASNMMKGSNRDMAEPEYNSYDINQLLMVPQGVHVQGGDQRFLTGSRNNKVDGRCYNCGSPDHLIRYCPIVLNPHHMFQAGVMPSYATPYWGGGAFLPVDPYMHMYGNQGMVPFGGSMAPVTPYGLPNYLPTMGSNLLVPSGTMMGGLAAPSGLRSELPVTHSENLEPQHGDGRRMSSGRNSKWLVDKRRQKHSHSTTARKGRRPYHNVDYKSERYDEMRCRKHH